MLAVDLSLCLGLCLFALPLIVESRQMCYYCGYQSGVGPACVDDPKSWKNGDPHFKCEFDCVLNAIFSADTGKPTFVHRGCQETDQKNGCDKTGATHTCFFSCSGQDYCNDRDLSRSPLVDSDAAPSLTPLSPLGLLLHACSLSAVLVSRLALDRMYG